MNTEDLNNDIFEMVKASLTGEGIDKTLFTKVCTGQATEKEISDFNRKIGVGTEDSSDIMQKLMESCKLGFNMASQLDSSDTFPKNEEIAQLKNKVITLEERISALENILKNMQINK